MQSSTLQNHISAQQPVSSLEKQASLQRMMCFPRYVSVAFNDYRTPSKQNFKHLGKGEGTHQVKRHL